MRRLRSLGVSSRRKWAIRLRSGWGSLSWKSETRPNQALHLPKPPNQVLHLTATPIERLQGSTSHRPPRQVSYLLAEEIVLPAGLGQRHAHRMPLVFATSDIAFLGTQHGR